MSEILSLVEGLTWTVGGERVKVADISMQCFRVLVWSLLLLYLRVRVPLEM